MLGDFTQDHTWVSMTIFSLVTLTMGWNCSDEAHYMLWIHGIRCALKPTTIPQIITYLFVFGTLSSTWLLFCYFQAIICYLSDFFFKVNTFFRSTLLVSNSAFEVRIMRHTILLTVLQKWFWPFPTSCISFYGSSIGRRPNSK